MAHIKDPAIGAEPQRRRRLGTLAGVLLMMGASLAAAGCDLPDDAVADPSFTPGAQAAADFLPNSTIILDRDDLLAVAAPGVAVTPSVIRDIESQFHPDAQRAIHGRIEVAYLGPIEFDSSRPAGAYDQGARSGTVDLSALDQDTNAVRALPGHRVMWANFETGNFYLIRYPHPDWVDKDIPVLDEYDPAPTPDQSNPAGPDVDIDWLRSRRYRLDAQGVLMGQETRQRVFDPNDPSYDKLYKRTLSMGGATGALIGQRHFLTAAHVLVEHDDQTGRLRLFDVSVHAGRNGNSQIGDNARVTQLWWMADWTRSSWGTRRRANDLAWGVLNRPMGDEVGYFGLMSTSTRNLRAQGLTLRNAGFPSCSPTSAPVPPGCLRRHIFVDTQDCAILREDEPDFFGWGQAVAHGCDANRGYGGSPLIVDKDGSLYLWAVHSGATNRLNYASRLTRSHHQNLIEGMFARYPRHEET